MHLHYFLFAIGVAVLAAGPAWMLMILFQESPETPVDSGLLLTVIVFSVICGSAFLALGSIVGSLNRIVSSLFPKPKKSVNKGIR
ncbi:MAG: hypothetical protein AB1510_10180 [Bacillota bacterium]